MERRYYIEARDAEGKQVLGNLDGQAVIRAKCPRRTRAWKRLAELPREKLSLNGKVRQYDLVTRDGKVLASIVPWSAS